MASLSIVKPLLIYSIVPSFMLGFFRVKVIRNDKSILFSHKLVLYVLLRTLMIESLPILWVGTVYLVLCTWLDLRFGPRTKLFLPNSDLQDKNHC